MTTTLTPVLAVRDAILAALKATPRLVAECDDRIADAVPTTGPLAKLPNITIGPANLRRGENGADALGLVRLRIFVGSKEPRRDQAWGLAQIIADKIEGTQPALSGDFHLIDIVRVVEIGDVLDKLAPSEVFLDVTTIVQRNQ